MSQEVQGTESPELGSGARSKPPWRSKTYWGNLLTAAALPLVDAIPGEWLAQYPKSVAYGIIVLNLILRHYSDGKIQIRR